MSMPSSTAALAVAAQARRMLFSCVVVGRRSRTASGTLSPITKRNYASMPSSAPSLASLLHTRTSSVLSASTLVPSPFVSSVSSRFFASPTASSSSSSPALSGSAKAKAQKQRRQEKKKTAAHLIKVRTGPTFHLDEAVRILKSLGANGVDYNQTVDVQVQLGIDPRKTNVNVRGVAPLPHGRGRNVVIAVFARGDKAEEARKAGAAVVGAEDLVERISKGDTSFDRIIATPDVMPLVGRVARILGPRGLMPNPKLGTVTLAIKEAVQAAKRGQAEFRAEKRGIVSAPVGKLSFSSLELKENIRSLLVALYDAKPEGFKGSAQYFKAVFVSSTQQQGGIGAIPVDLASVDPASTTFMSTWDGQLGGASVAQAQTTA